MSTITATISTTVSAIPALRHRDTVLVFPADQDDFVAKYEATNDHLSGTTVAELNAIGNEIDLVTSQINTVAGEVNTNAGIATTKATLSADYAEKMALQVEAGTYSSKEHAIGDLTATGGSAKAWAIDTASPDGTTAKSAKTWAVEAAVSAADALASQNAAAALLDAFDDRYLGSKTVAPTLDNDGNPLLSGAFYWNSALNTMYVYDLALTTWVAISFIPTAHSGLSGLANDDHTQYHNDARGDARYAKLSGSNLTGALNTARATVASHATTADIWGALGNQIDWTGTAVTTAFPNAPQAGAERTLICAGACSFTAGANMLIDGVASGGTVVCAAGDTVIVRAVSTTQFKLTRLKADGTAQVSTTTAFNGCSLYKTANQTIAASTTTLITWDAEYYDTNSLHDNVTNNGRITVDATGKWRVNATAQYQTAGTTRTYLLLYVNGVSTRRFYHNGSHPLNLTTQINEVLSLSASDYLELHVFSFNAGGDILPGIDSWFTVTYEGA